MNKRARTCLDSEKVAWVVCVRGTSKRLRQRRQRCSAAVADDSQEERAGSDLVMLGRCTAKASPRHIRVSTRRS